MDPQVVKKLFLYGNHECQQKNYWAESLIKSIPNPKAPEFIEFLEGTQHHGTKDNDKIENKKLTDKYPALNEQNSHLSFCFFLLMAKMDLVEGWNKVYDRKYYYKELERRLKRLFPKLTNKL